MFMINSTKSVLAKDAKVIPENMGSPGICSPASEHLVMALSRLLSRNWKGGGVALLT